MKVNVVGLLGGIVFGFTLAWAQLTDPHVIRAMLLLNEAHAFLIMGSAVLVAAIGVRWLKASGVRTAIGREPIAWTVERPRLRHIVGSVLFGAGWSVVGTCPGPLAAMVGEGRLAAAPVAVGLLAGVVVQRVLIARRVMEVSPSSSAAAGL